MKPQRQLLLALLVCTFLNSVSHLCAEEPELRWMKGNIHTHSLWSDGNDFPEMIAEWYRTHGYNFLALTDHNVLAEGTKWFKNQDIAKRGGEEALAKYLDRFGKHWVETRGTEGTANFEVRLKPLNEYRALVEERGKFLMLAAEEISDRSEGVPVRMNATNVNELIRPVGGATVAEAIENNFRAAQEQAERTGREILVHLNHPNFGLAVTAEDLAKVLSEKFFEVYNGHPGVKHLGDEHHPSVERMWDIANTIRIAQLKAAPLYGIATDDSHHYHGKGSSRLGRGWIMVRSRFLTPEHLIKHVKAGDFYASSGVTLSSIEFDPKTDNTLKLSIDGNPDVKYTTQFIGTLVEYDAESTVRTDKDGKKIRSSRKYSSEVGQVLAVAEGLKPSYKLQENELYVRAVITSNKAHGEPSFSGQVTQAWTQPIGWEKHLAK